MIWCQLPSLYELALFTVATPPGYTPNQMRPELSMYTCRS